MMRSNFPVRAGVADVGEVVRGRGGLDLHHFPAEVRAGLLSSFETHVVEGEVPAAAHVQDEGHPAGQGRHKEGKDRHHKKKDAFHTHSPP
jgi:hypothetical protein